VGRHSPRQRARQPRASLGGARRPAGQAPLYGILRDRGARACPDPVHDPPAVRDAGQARSAAPRGRREPGGGATGVLPGGDTAAEPARHRLRLHPDVHPRLRLVRHAGAARWQSQLDGRDGRAGPVSERLQLAAGVGGGHDAPGDRAGRGPGVQPIGGPRADLGGGPMSGGGGGRALLRAYVTLVSAFLFFPIMVVVLLSFTENITILDLSRLTTRWYRQLWQSGQILRALVFSVEIGLACAALATVLG